MHCANVQLAAALHYHVPFLLLLLLHVNLLVGLAIENIHFHCYKQINIYRYTIYSYITHVYECGYIVAESKTKLYKFIYSILWHIMKVEGVGEEPNQMAAINTWLQNLISHFFLLAAPLQRCNMVSSTIIMVGYKDNC